MVSERRSSGSSERDNHGPRRRNLAPHAEASDIPQYGAAGLIEGAAERCSMIDESQFDSLIDAGTTLLRIALQEEWRPAIRLHLGISLSHAEAVLAFPLPDEIDPAPVFEP